MISAVILAAGDSVRMGEPKALLQLNGQSFIEIIITRLKDAGFEEIMVVAGIHYKNITQHLATERDIRLLNNTNPEQGQLSSLQLAIPELNTVTTGMLMVLVDHPLVTQASYRKFYESAHSHSSNIIVPVYNDKKGHPVYFSRLFFEPLLKAPLSEGARYVVRGNPDAVHLLHLEDPGILKDIDTPEEYERYIKNTVRS